MGLVDPYFSTDLGQLYHGDCLEILPQLPDDSVDMVLTDPPYGSGGRDGAVHLRRGDIIGNKMSSDSYVWFVRKYAKFLYAITKDNSHCYIFSDWRKYKDVQIAFETACWELRSLIVWNKGVGMGEYWRSAHEFILFFTKRKPKKLTHGGCFNVISCSAIRDAYPVSKPLQLVEILIEASSKTNDVVLDSFLGSGTTAVACEKLGRRWIGMEISEEYCEKARERIEIEANKLKLFEVEGDMTPPQKDPALAGEAGDKPRHHIENKKEAG